MKISSGSSFVLLLLLGLAVVYAAFSWAIRHAEEVRGAHDGSALMRRRLAALALAADPEHQPFLNRRRALALEKAVASETGDPEERFDLQIRLGLELLRSGDSRAAIRTLQSVPPPATAGSPQEAVPHGWIRDQFLAIAHLRLAEQENCVLHHDTESCLLPIRGGGLHTRREGSKNAIELLLRCLAENPRDLTSQWLLNLAHMTLGQYPDGVPDRFRVPPTAFDSAEEVPRFRDVAKERGAQVFGLSGGAVADEFTGDGRIDIICSSWSLEDSLVFLVQQDDGTFANRSEEAGLMGITGGLNLCQADYDNDGWLDLLVLRGAWLGREGLHPNSLLRNRGDGTFLDVTEASGLHSSLPTQTAAWADFDNDGWLDLFIGNESVTEEGQRHPCELYRSDGRGKFQECAADYGVAHVGFVKGVTWGDIDNDGWQDLYLSCLGERNVLYHNRSRVPPLDSDGTNPGVARIRSFVDITDSAGVAEPEFSFPTWFWDYDQDGWLDLFVAPYTWDRATARVASGFLHGESPGPEPRLYRNRGDGTFDDVTRVARLDRTLVVMGANFGDLDNDGFPDMYLGTGEPNLASLMPSCLFRNADGRRFVDVTTSADMGHLQKGHGIAFADLDADGDQDVYAVFGGAYEGDGFQNALFENPGREIGGEPEHRWLTLRLRGTKSNHSALGARITVTLETAAGETTVHARVSSGGSFGGNSLQQEIGLGETTRISSLRVQWPGGAEEEFLSVPLDSICQVEEGSGKVDILAETGSRANDPRPYPYPYPNAIQPNPHRILLQRPSVRLSTLWPHHAHRRRHRLGRRDAVS